MMSHDPEDHAFRWTREACPECTRQGKIAPMKDLPSQVQVGGEHYASFKMQPTEFIHINEIPFIEGNVIKYVTRHRQKNGRQDIEKAIHYLELLLEWEYGNEKI